MDEELLLERAVGALEARDAEGDAFLERRRTLELKVRNGELEELLRAEVGGLGVRAMRDGRLGFVHTSKLDDESVTRAADQAWKLAGAASERDDLVLAEASRIADGRDEGASMQLFDASIETRPIREKEDLLRETEAVAMGVSPLIERSEGATYKENLSAYWIANTKGLLRHYQKSTVEVGVDIMAERGEDKQSGGYQHTAIRWDGLPPASELGRRAGERGVRLLGGRPVPTGRYPVVFTPEAGWALLVYVATALDGTHLSRGRSWITERPDAVIGSRLVTIRDDGRHPEGPATRPFDGEGVDTSNHMLVDQGKVSGYILDLATAKRLGMRSTGSSTRGGYEQLPETGTGNLYLVPGSVPPEELIAGVDDGFLALGLSGWWIGNTPSNTEFSSAAFGLWIEGGEPTRPVARVTVAGSIDKILGGIDGVAHDLVWNQSTKTPTFRVTEMAVSGT